MFSKRRKTGLYIFMLVIVIFLGLISCSNDQAQSSEKEKEEEKFTWLPYDLALTKSGVENIPTLLYFYSDNCSWCRKMEKENFGNKEVQGVLMKSFASVRVNSDSSNTVIVNEQKITERRLASEIYEVRGFPSIWFLDSENQRIANLPGFVPTDTFLDILRYIGEGFYKKYTFLEYMELE